MLLPGSAHPQTHWTAGSIPSMLPDVATNVKDPFPAWTQQQRQQQVKRYEQATRQARIERDQALRDANRFIRLAARIIPKRTNNWKEKFVYEANTEAGTAVVRYIETGEIVVERRLCSRTTKSGDRCKSFAINSADTCFVHATEQELLDAGFTKDQVRKKPKVMLALDALVEQEVDKIFGVYVNALDAVDLFGNVDHRTRMVAANELMDRTQGKATSKQEVSGPDGDALQFLFTSEPGEITDSE
jgi:hypothetical protein